MAKSNYYLAVDVGAESGRLVCGTLKGKKLSVREAHRFPNRMLQIGGHRHWDIYQIYANILDGIKMASAEMKAPPRSLGIDTWGVDFALLDRRGNILALPRAYRDARRETMQDFLDDFSRERLYELTGIQILPFNSVFQLYGLVQEQNPILELAHSLLFIPDLLNYLLTGEQKTEFTFATTSQMYNPKKHVWDKEILNAMWMPGRILCEVVPPGSVIGKVRPELFDELGSFPVVAPATHDTGSAVAAIPAEGEDWAFISSGTWSLIGIETPRPIITEDSMLLNYTNEGGVGGTFRFLKNIMGMWLVQRCAIEWAKKKKHSYEDLAKLAGKATPFKALIDPAHESFFNPPNMPLAIQDFCRSTGQYIPKTPGEITRCILESLALEYRTALANIRSVSGREINRLHVIGGGSRNKLLCQFTADATGVPVYAGPVEATAIGNLLVQAQALGDLESVADIRRVVKNSFKPVCYKPRSTDTWSIADEKFRSYKKHSQF